MSEYVSRCYKCLAPNPAWGSTLCAACRQIESIENSANRTRQAEAENAQLMAAQARENARMQAQIQEELYEQNERNAQLARRQSRENARLAAEGGVSYDDAYQYGYNYLKASGVKVKFQMNLRGELSIYRDVFWEPYKMEHLVQAFDLGFEASVAELNLINPGRAYIDNAVYSLGYDFNPYFYISYSTDVYGITREFKTDAYRTNFKRQINTATGEVEYFYDQPFKDEELNLTYTIGVNNKYTELNENTPEQIEERMRTEVADILAAQKQQSDQVAADNKQYHQQLLGDVRKANLVTAIVIGLFVAAVVGAVVLWNNNHAIWGFITLVAGSLFAVKVRSASRSVYTQAEFCKGRMKDLGYSK